MDDGAHDRDFDAVAAGRWRDALNAMLDDVVIGRAIRNADGEIVDFEIEFMNDASIRTSRRRAEELVGRRISELYPNWRASGVFGQYRAVVETGTPFVVDRFSYRDAFPGVRGIAGFWDLQVVRFGDGYLAATRNVTDIVRAEETLRVAAQLAEREHVAVSLLQRAALPTELPTLRRALVGAHYQPAIEQPLGGDWYDVFELDDHSVALVIADVAGHGPDAAAFMVQIRNVVRALAVEHLDPARILGRANHVVLALHDDATPLTTCCVARLELDSLQLTWALAGHPPPLVVTADGPRDLPGARPGPPLGVSDDATYATGTASLAGGDRVVLYTDGLVERRDEPIDLGMARLGRAIAESRSRDPQAAAEWLAATVSLRRDDVALVVVDIGPEA